MLLVLSGGVERRGCVVRVEQKRHVWVSGRVGVEQVGAVMEKVWKWAVQTRDKTRFVGSQASRGDLQWEAPRRMVER